jgi:hypothetical protein
VPGTETPTSTDEVPRHRPTRTPTVTPETPVIDTPNG